MKGDDPALMTERSCIRVGDPQLRFDVAVQESCTRAFCVQDPRTLDRLLGVHHHNGPVGMKFRSSTLSDIEQPPGLGRCRDSQSRGRAMLTACKRPRGPREQRPVMACVVLWKGRGLLSLTMCRQWLRCVWRTAFADATFGPNVGQERSTRKAVHREHEIMRWPCTFQACNSSTSTGVS